jgi:hypothetical protein
MSCLSDDAVTEFVEGRMGAEEASLVDRHMADCAACRSWVADAARLAFDEGEESPLRAPKPGDRVGRYRLLEILGVGGMGVVYTGEDPELGRKIALKVIRTDLVAASGIELQKRLQHEARAMAKISHPNVVIVHDIGTIDGHVFVAMEYVQGKNLREWLSSEERPFADVVDTFLAAGQGLAAAHAVGLVHRDFKPENVLRGDDGRVRVTDFGLARGEVSGSERPFAPKALSVTDVARAETMTRTGALVGTPAYMAPEQLVGSAADARSDQFSFCVALFEALYRKRPFPTHDVGELKDAIAQGNIAAAPPDAKVPLQLHAIVSRGLRSNPDERFPSILALLDALAAQRAEVGEARPAPPPDLPAPSRRGRRPALAAGALGLSIVMAGGAWLFSRAPAAPASPAATAAPKTSRPAGPNECTKGPGTYCDGHGVDGEVKTLYRCENGRIREEKKCAVACLHLIGDAIDACDVDTAKCPIGNGVYCGGSHLSADPKTLYRCTGGTLTVLAVCSTRCVMEPNGVRDHCE